MTSSEPKEYAREAALSNGEGGELISFSPGVSVNDSNNLVLAFCLDGTVYALEAKTGAIMWRITCPFTEGPLLKKSSKAASNNSNVEYIIEPLGDGTIFQMGSGDVKRLPFTLKSLVHLSPLHWKEDENRSIYLIAKRESSLFVLDLLTAKVERRQFSSKDGEIDDQAEMKENLQLSKLGRNSLLIGRSDYHVQGFAEDNLEALWKISLTQFKSLYGMSSVDSDSESFGSKYDFYTTFNGHLVSKQTTGPWVAKLASPILQMFRPITTEKGFISLQEIHFKSSESSASSSKQHVQFDHTRSTFYFEDLVNIGVLEDGSESILFVLPQACYPLLRNRTPKLSLEGGIENEVDSEHVSTSVILNNYKFLSSQRVSRQFVPLPVKLLDEGGPVVIDGKDYKIYGTILVLLASVIFFLLRVRNKRRKSEEGNPPSALLEVSDDVLGYGSHGTIVFRGQFDGRAVAVKRLLAEFYSLADREINLLLNHDVHPNIIRYFYREKQEKFILVALELADCTLQEYVNPTENFATSSGNYLEEAVNVRVQKNAKAVAFKDEIKTITILMQIMRGVEFLHEKGLVHRDLKPQNILLQLEESAKSGKRARVLISDFGLSKKLVEMESSFHATAKAAGTLGWRAPEIILNDEVSKFRDFTANGSSDSLGPMKISKSVDIFAAGLVFYFVLSGGEHAFGPRLARESNISTGKLFIESKYLSVEAEDLIRWMLSRKPKDRPTAQQVLHHPFFWINEKRLDFICTVSDVLEAEERNAKREQTVKAPPGFEGEISVDLPMRDAIDAIGDKVYPNSATWHREIDRHVFQDLTKHRYYMVNKFHDLMRAIRNKRNHFHETPADVQSILGSSPQDAWNYFEAKFPRMLMESYRVMKTFRSADLQVLEKFYT